MIGLALLGLLALAGVVGTIRAARSDGFRARPDDGRPREPSSR